MPAKPQGNWTQLGWKVWVYRDPDIESYSSKDYTWSQVPSNGLQMMLRFYTDGTRSWREMITGQDIYFEEDIAKDVIPSNVATFFKIGTNDDSKFHDALLELRADTTHTVNNTIAKYVETKKTLLGWQLWNVAGKYSSSSHSWSDIPTFGTLMMNKYWKSGPDRWIEQISGQDIYFLNNVTDEATLISTYSFMKNGSVIDSVKLEEIHQLLLADTEVFS